MNNTVTAQDLVGAWRLDSFLIRYNDERPPMFPFGTDAKGILTYTSSGHMSAILSRADRAPLNADRLENAARAPSKEKAAAFDSFLSYSGTFYVEHAESAADAPSHDVGLRGHVVHVVELSSVPNTIGHEHVRAVELRGDTLKLSYTITPQSGVTRFYELSWHRL